MNVYRLGYRAGRVSRCLLVTLCVLAAVLSGGCRKDEPTSREEAGEPERQVSATEVEQARSAAPAITAQGEPGVSEAKRPVTSEPSEMREAVAERPVVLTSALGGTWYPADASALTREIEGLFEGADGEQWDDVIALILPHAGYRWSGRVAALGLSRAGRAYGRVIVIGPTHRLGMEDILSVPRVTHYETPLGRVPLDVEFIESLLAYPEFQNVPQAHQDEHSVQIEVPLVQFCQRDFTLVPIVAGQCSLETLSRAAEILRSLVDGETLVIVSSDFVHYGPSHRYVPAGDDVPGADWL